MEKSPMAALQDIEDIFSIFHDGGIISVHGDSDLLTIRVDIPYLAKRIDPSYQYFFLECSNVEELQMKAWTYPVHLPQLYFNEINEIFQLELTILYACITGNFVTITCDKPDSRNNYLGGDLYFSCQEIKIFDERKNKITVDALDILCNAYWKERRQETERRILEEWSKKHK